MLEDHVQVWNNCIELIERSIPAQQFQTWFNPIKPVKLEDQVLTIQVANKFIYEWLEEHYIDILRKAIFKVLGEKGRLEYQIIVENHRKIGQVPKKKDNNASSYDVSKIKNPFVIPGIRKLKVDSQLNPKYLFSNFIEGDCNKLARSAGHAVANAKESSGFNPLVMYGDVGLGKTHLAQAIGNEIVAKDSGKSVLYVTTEKFTNQVIDSIRKGALNDFTNFYQNIDVLIVDDIQFLSGRTKTAEIFFNIFNALHQQGKQIILTSDRAPKDLQDVEQRLISRFKWGLTADLKSPAYETRQAILEEKISRENLVIPADVIEYICFNVKKNIRELEGVIISIMAQATLTKREITIDLAKEVLNQFVSQLNKELTVANISALVSEHFSVSLEKIQGKTRKREVVMARQLSMYLAKNYTTQPLKEIGKNFGGRDHSTVIYSIKAVQDLMDTDHLFKDTVAELEKKVQLSLQA
jgi:chromosomal replication initiator protein